MFCQNDQFKEGNSHLSTFNLAFEGGCGCTKRGREKLANATFFYTRYNATSFKTSVLSCWVHRSVVVTWRAWTCAAAAAQSLWRTASAPSRWGCSPAAQSKACGPRRPASDSRREWRAPPHREPGLTQNCFTPHSYAWENDHWFTKRRLIQCPDDSNSRQFNTETPDISISSVDTIGKTG